MTKPFSIPEAPTDEEIEIQFKLQPSHPIGILDRPMSRNLKKMRDQMLPHRKAAFMMFDVLISISENLESHSYQCVLGECHENCSMRKAKRAIDSAINAYSMTKIVK